MTIVKTGGAATGGAAAHDGELRGRAALVTGSTGGIGLAIVQALAAAGADVVMHGIDAPREPQARCAAIADAHRVRATYVQADVATEAGVRALLDGAQQAMGRAPDVLVNNAVVRHFAAIDAFPVDAWERALAVNVSAAFHAVRLLLPAMRARGWGRIINMSSVYGSRGTADRVDYVTTKSALLGFTRAVAMETVHDGITCNAVCPGTVATPAIESRIAGKMAAGLARNLAEREVLVGKQPTGRFVEADAVAAMIVFLCGRNGRDITGAMLPIEGGWLAG